MLYILQVQGTANPPVCKIMDYHKEKYKKETREKEQIKIKVGYNLYLFFGFGAVRCEKKYRKKQFQVE